MTDEEISRLVDEFQQGAAALRATLPTLTGDEAIAARATLDWVDQVVAAILTNDVAAKRRLLGDRSGLN